MFDAMSEIEVAIHIDDDNESSAEIERVELCGGTERCNKHEGIILKGNTAKGNRSHIKRRPLVIGARHGSAY